MEAALQAKGRTGESRHIMVPSAQYLCGTDSTASTHGAHYLCGKDSTICACRPSSVFTHRTDSQTVASRQHVPLTCTITRSCSNPFLTKKNVQVIDGKLMLMCHVFPLAPPPHSQRLRRRSEVGSTLEIFSCPVETYLAGHSLGAMASVCPLYLAGTSCSGSLQGHLLCPGRVPRPRVYICMQRSPMRSPEQS